jgi:hypothetical protein
MSPLAVEMLIWFCTRGAEAGPFHNIGRDPQQEILSWFLRDGIIDRGDEFARATDKGKAWLSLILNTPMPVNRWTDPRSGKPVEEWP